ncbi:Mitochondrial Rho GTPase 2 [Desmophyllum pertusum]|uniref:Mitochondrial Rho GTPase 2 n=1 Tax=Desmophyllum pertusum TaxID=174260 RepID=A0A9W9YPH5_9CNID|nr:Mitochondrial Rho GTPase 2 [Desmophyllum pertusum]
MFSMSHGRLPVDIDSVKSVWIHFSVIRSKAVDLQKKQTSRSVFQCYVFGPPGVGKTAFLQAFLGRTLEPGESEKVLSSYAIDLLEVNRQEKYVLALREIEWENSGFLLHDRRCDVACFIYDSTDPASFTQVVQLREKLPKTVPCMLVAGKSEGVPAKQDFEMQPSLYCTLNKLPPPQTPVRPQCRRCSVILDRCWLSGRARSNRWYIDVQILKKWRFNHVTVTGHPRKHEDWLPCLCWEKAFILSELNNQL